MPVTGDLFRQALGHFASGVTVVTAAHGDTKVGLTVSAFCSVSLNPPLILVCIDKRSSSIDVIRDSQAFAVSILGQADANLSNHFASRSDDKFSSVAHSMGQLGCPILENVLGYLECKVASDIDAGDHIVFIGEVEAAGVEPDKQPLLYYHGSYGDFTPR